MLLAKFGATTAMSWEQIRALAARGALRERHDDA
jgi:hypothetical protein